MPLTRPGRAGGVLAWLVAGALLAASCASPPPPPPRPAPAPPPPPERPPAPRSDLTFPEGIAFAVDDLFIQLQRLPAFAPGAHGAAADQARRSVIVVDTIIDAATGQQTQATQLAEREIHARTREKFQQLEVLPANPESVARASHVVTATLTPVKEERGVYRLAMAMVELRGVLVVAQAAVRIRDESVDVTPTPFYRDSPAVAKDRVIEGQIRTSETPVDRPADSVYIERLPTGALMNEGLAAFNNGAYAQALPYYEEAARRPDGQQLRVYNGLYMIYWNLGRGADAEAAFGKIAAIGLATNNLAVKFLFRPGSTDFWADPRISGPYPIWLRQLARQVASTHTCLQVIGHTSRTGSEPLNERLSLRRAEVIRQRLLAEARDPSMRIETAGVGSRENLIGSGTDDQRDALDRRVEFRVVQCPA
jgi:outer membrane protein OmpA-like peptidoglycan-associated protein